MPLSPDSLLNDVRSVIRRASISPEDLLLVGLSGGVDSQTLTHCLSTLRDRGDGPKLHAVHVDHRLRPGSKLDAEQCRRVARRMNVPCDVIHVDVNAWDRGRGVEAAARDARFAALAQAAQLLGTPWVALGHSLDDQVETVLMRLARGTSLDGLTAMREISHRAVPLSPDGATTAAVDLLRPLLGRTRAAIEQYASDHGLSPIEDPSNADPRFRRNAVRHQLLPLLEQIAPGSRGSIARSIKLLASDAAFLEGLATQATARCVTQLDACLVIERMAFTDLPDPVQRRVVATTVHLLSAHVDLTSERIEAVQRAIISGAVNRRIEVGGGLDILIDYGRAALGQADHIEPTLRAHSGLPLLDRTTELSVAESGYLALQNDWILDVSMGSSTNVWSLRTRRPGDCVSWGNGVSHRLQDWFVNRKVPAYARDYIPLLVRGEEVRWIAGFSSTTFEDVDSGLKARLVKSTKDNRPDDERVTGYPPA